MNDELDVDDSEYFSPLRVGLATGLAFAIGAVVPVLMVTFIHTSAGTEVSLLAVALSLTLTSIIGARLGGTRPWVTAARAVTIGLLTLGLASLAGSFLD